MKKFPDICDDQLIGISWLSQFHPMFQHFYNLPAEVPGIA